MSPSKSTEQQTHEFFMQKALEQAQKAQDIGEVPVGAVLVYEDKVIGEGYNQCITQSDPSLHAEVLAIRDAAKRLQNYRLLDTRLYVTLEPCAMCAGLLVHARIKQIIFGTHDPKTGAAGSVINLLQHEYVNHKVDIVGGIMQEVCAERLSAFFADRRKQIKHQKRLKLEKQHKL
jgi:tRNA(adenine34) deaminase